MNKTLIIAIAAISLLIIAALALAQNDERDFLATVEGEITTTGTVEAGLLPLGDISTNVFAVEWPCGRDTVRNLLDNESEAALQIIEANASPELIAALDAAAQAWHDGQLESAVEKYGGDATVERDAKGDIVITVPKAVEAVPVDAVEY